VLGGVGGGKKKKVCLWGGGGGGEMADDFFLDVCVGLTPISAVWLAVPAVSLVLATTGLHLW